MESGCGEREWERNVCGDGGLGRMRGKMRRKCNVMECAYAMEYVSSRKSTDVIGNVNEWNYKSIKKT